MFIAHIECFVYTTSYVRIKQVHTSIQSIAKFDVRIANARMKVQNVYFPFFYRQLLFVWIESLRPYSMGV